MASSVVKSVPALEERAALEALLSSGALGRCMSSQSLLRYVCEKYFEGKAAEIKEYSIAVDALGRPPDFDPKASALVRVEAHRLRKKLQDYYRAEGAHLPIQIVLPEGSYVPQFRVRENAEQAAEPLGPPLVPVETGLSSGSRSGRQRGIRLLLAACAAALLVAVFVVWRSSRPAGSRFPSAHTTAGTHAPHAAVANSPAIRILAGRGPSTYEDRFGHIWEGDKYFRGGTAVVPPAGTNAVRGYDRNVFMGRREGEFGYDIPVRPGRYELRLYFAETEYGENNPQGGGEGSRIMDISLNGRAALSSLDVIEDAGQPNWADVKILRNVSPAADGLVHLDFHQAGLSAPFLNALELLPDDSGHGLPLRFIAQENPFRDRHGRDWEPDRFVTGGVLIQRPGPPAHVTVGEPEWYQGERYGRFRYAIPVAPGNYNVNLYFAETWFGPGQPGKGGIGSRVFSVYCNHQLLLHDFDILKEAGAPSTTICKSFHGLKADAQGKLILSFEPQINWASINAIEIVSAD